MEQMASNLTTYLRASQWSFTTLGFQHNSIMEPLTAAEEAANTIMGATAVLHRFLTGLEKRAKTEDAINPLRPIGNSLKKQKSLYKVLTPSIKPPI